MSGWNPPPAGPPGLPGGPGPQGPFGPPGPHGGPAPGMPAPPPGPPRRKRGPGLLIGLLAGAFVLVLAIAGGAFAFFYLGTSHELSTPSVAGGMSRDTKAEDQLEDTIDILHRVVMNTARVDGVKYSSAVYRDGDKAYIFVGSTGPYKEDNIVTSLDRVLRSELSTGAARVTTQTYEIENSGGDGKAVCSRLTASATSVTAYSHNSVCTWATRTTFGLVMPVKTSTSQKEAPEYKVQGLQRVMRAIRADVED